MEMKDNWRGKFFDSNGRNGTIEVFLQTEGEKKRGTLKLQIIERDSPPIIHQAKIEVDTTKEGNDVRFQHKLSDGSLAEWSCNFYTENAKPYAKSSMFGIYRMKGGLFEIPLSRGVAILWQFVQDK